MTAPTQCPPSGLTLPVRLHQVRDGDTVELEFIAGGAIWPVRLIDCWCPELRSGPDWKRKIAYEALNFARATLEAADEGDLRVHVPMPKVRPGKRINLLRLFTFDRLPGWLYVGPTQTLNRMLVERGLASSTKDGELGT